MYKRPLGKIDQFSVTVSTRTIIFKAIVTKAVNYAIIVGNDWMRKAQAQIN
ncbi:5788_t:CDS:2 [Gigaspora margarita]|uniref:5788_t:CDS:1 n=1 Tax=Gigaspora margarita TaxID=4874 RepID=A0ABM8W6Q5_GIGMA|nr:5788_t:CDS:2 [Gigaspora margarita]